MTNGPISGGETTIDLVEGEDFIYPDEILGAIIRTLQARRLYQKDLLACG